MWAIPTPGNNTATDTNALALQAQLSVTKTLLSASPVAAGGAVQYRIQVSNAGPSAAQGVGVVDTVSSLLTNVGLDLPAHHRGIVVRAVQRHRQRDQRAGQRGRGRQRGAAGQWHRADRHPGHRAGQQRRAGAAAGTTDPTPGDNSATTPAVPVQPNALVANNDMFATRHLLDHRRHHAHGAGQRHAQRRAGESVPT